MADINVFASIGSKLVTTLSSILPVAHDQYSGTATTYALYTVYNSIPEVVASGKNHQIGIYGDLDVFSESDLSGAESVVDAIISALNAAGVVVPDCRDIPYDGVKHRKLIEFYVPVKR